MYLPMLEYFVEARDLSSEISFRFRFQKCSIYTYMVVLISEFSEDSDSGTDTIEGPRPLVAEILQHANSSCGTVVTAEGDPQHTHVEDKSDVICAKPSYYYLPMKTKAITEIQQEKSAELVPYTERKIRNYCKADGCEEEESNSPRSYWFKNYMLSSTKKQIKDEITCQEKLSDPKSSIGGMKGNKDNRVEIKEAKQILEEEIPSSSHYPYDV